MNQSSGSLVQTEIFSPKNIKLYTKYTERYRVIMSLNCYVPAIGTFFSIPLAEKIFIENAEISIDKLTIDFLKKYIWKWERNNLKELVNNTFKLDLWHVNVDDADDVYTEVDIVQKLGGEKMKPFHLFNYYFSQPLEVGKIHIIIHRPTITDQRHTDISRIIANLGYLPRHGGLGGTLLPTDLRVKSTNEGIVLTDPDISLRFDIIPPLIHDLMEKKIILIQAPPFAGKTSTAQILENSLVQSLEHSNYRVIRVSMIWGMSAGVENCYESFEELWKEMFGIGWSEWIAQCKHIKTVLIIDEAQLIYKEDQKIDEKDKKTADQFWTIVKGCLQ